MKYTHLLPLLALMNTAAFADDLKLGIIGLDTSHVAAFTKILNDDTAPNHLAGAKIVAAYKSFSPDIESSASRVEGYTTTLRDTYGVKMMDSIEDLCKEVDGVLIENLDGRPHLEHARKVIAAKKPM